MLCLPVRLCIPCFLVTVATKMHTRTWSIFVYFSAHMYNSSICSQGILYWYCRVPARWGLQQIVLAPGSDETWARDPYQNSENYVIRRNNITLYAMTVGIIALTQYVIIQFIKVCKNWTSKEMCFVFLDTMVPLLNITLGAIAPWAISL